MAQETTIGRQLLRNQPFHHPRGLLVGRTFTYISTLQRENFTYTRHSPQFTRTAEA